MVRPAISGEILFQFAPWTDPKGVEPELLSFAAITDEPDPEVAAAGHDRTIINIKPEHVDVWLSPDPAIWWRSKPSSMTSSIRFMNIARRLDSRQAGDRVPKQ